MSEPDEKKDEGVVFDPLGDTGFSTFMSAFSSTSSNEEGEEGGEATVAPADGAGQPATPVEGAGAGEADAAAPAGGDGGQPEVQDPAPAAGSATDGAAATTGTDSAGQAGAAGEDGSGAGEVDVQTLAKSWGEMSNSIEKRTLQQHQSAALEDVKKEYPKYFEALETHPRRMVGARVPAASKDEPGQDAEGFIVLKDSKDAEEWQAAIKDHMVSEVRSATNKRMESNGGELQTLHQSIELFQNNSDLVPGTKQFDRELADAFAEMASAYEVRKDGKLQGYSIAVQPLIDRLRTQIAAKRTAAPSTNPAAPAAAPSNAAGAAAQPADQPQAGISSKAGNSVEGENYDTLWGTLGLGGIRI